MKTTRIISAFLFYLVRIISLFYFATTLYIIIVTSLKTTALRILENNRFAVCYPFTNKNFILGSEYNLAYIIEMVVTLAFYSLFFFGLSNVFKAFKQTKLFTCKGVFHLKVFYITNLLIAPIVFGIISIQPKEDFPYLAMIVAHAIIGIFAFFIAAIFQQGVNLQTDQDLII